MDKKITLQDVLAIEMQDRGFKESFEHYLEHYKIGLQVRQLRKEAGYTQVQLAQMLGISQQALSGIERGDSVNPGFGTIERIASAMGYKVRLEFEKVSA
jgi:DNA-binding XRE family transcriptional regulator